MSVRTEGLEGVVATTSAICDVRGVEGQLVYRGYQIQDLATHSTFEEVIHLLWLGELPSRSQLDDLSRQLASNRAISLSLLSQLRSYPSQANPMDVLRTAVSTMGLEDPDVADMSEAANLRKSIRLTAQMATVTAAFHRIRSGLEVVAPREDLSHAANFLYMLDGWVPGDTASRAMDLGLILQADHELNASTFAARVTAATLSDLHSAITSAIGALKGPLHGGANQQVMELLDEIGSVERVDGVVKEMLARKEKIPGFGHRVYRTEDPRAAQLREMSGLLAERLGNHLWFDLTCELERVVEANKPIFPNVDLYSGGAFRLLGIPLDLFTPVFAVSRISGWTAHVMEQYAHNRLIRPRAEYIGPLDRPYLAIDKR